ncbi:hypothetical protein CDD83_516 [Cordyceps sp. RAO-2017]|nr:hypothetical protein CDD83_516 [Cordyceps sp. RAO-2017]
MPLQKPPPRPFYAIAHRVLMSYGVRAALAHGANALEIDVHPWRHDKWYADHDGLPTSKGDSVETIFETVAAERRAGKNVIFVWLDIKDPDNCGRWEDRCNIERLRSLARGILEPVGVKVLYGFYSPKGRGFSIIRDSLNDNEAISLEGNADEVRKEYERGGPGEKRKRVMSKGLFYPVLNFGSCETEKKGICPQLRKASESNFFGKVFGWTITRRQQARAELLMRDAYVDGLIYGFVATHYYDHAHTRQSLSYITDWIKRNPEKRYLATIKDQPW